ncbi:hypothetical protein [Conchiformibius steedae]|uniref:hypothetical protein n=1 Tax=Conchiformibius steedae TaxID=153493 RepID=UPI0026EF122F|nr:hypothetical protein [Conchiformibius steedae]
MNTQQFATILAKMGVPAPINSHTRPVAILTPLVVGGLMQLTTADDYALYFPHESENDLNWNVASAVADEWAKHLPNLVGYAVCRSLSGNSYTEAHGHFFPKRLEAVCTRVGLCATHSGDFDKIVGGGEYVVKANSLSPDLYPLSGKQERHPPAQLPNFPDFKAFAHASTPVHFAKKHAAVLSRLGDMFAQLEQPSLSGKLNRKTVNAAKQIIRNIVYCTNLEKWTDSSIPDAHHCTWGWLQNQI